MTNKQFFIQTIEAEEPVFIKVLKAIPKDKLDWKPEEKARSIGRIAFQLATQPLFMLGVVKNGAPDWGEYRESPSEHPEIDTIINMAEKNFADLKAALTAMPDDDWENGKGVLAWPGGKWETKKYDMVWGFLFDGIHHRGQLTTYLRVMGAKVPSVYGGSADEPLQ